MSFGDRHQQWGVTQPISFSESNEGEKKTTLAMMEELRRQGTFESEEESQRRLVILRFTLTIPFSVGVITKILSMTRVNSLNSLSFPLISYSILSANNNQL